MYAALEDHGWIMKHMKIKRLLHDPAMYPPRQRRLVALLQQVKTLQAASQKPFVQGIQFMHLRDRANQKANGELISSRNRHGPDPRISLQARGKDEAPQPRGRMYD